MQIWGAAGLAIANVLAALVQSVLLWRALSARRAALSFQALRPALLKVLLAGAVMGLGCALVWPVLGALDLGEKFRSALTVAFCVPGGASLYFAVLYLLRFEELDALKAMLLRYLPKRFS
jgi:peptidoglycan biosynthesis protein MviN/MurJ (putative lipid II flippase)